MTSWCDVPPTDLRTFHPSAETPDLPNPPSYDAALVNGTSGDILTPKSGLWRRHDVRPQQLIFESPTIVDAFSPFLKLKKPDRYERIDEVTVSIIARLTGGSTVSVGHPGFEQILIPTSAIDTNEESDYTFAPNYLYDPADDIYLYVSGAPYYGSLRVQIKSHMEA